MVLGPAPEQHVTRIFLSSIFKFISFPGNNFSANFFDFLILSPFSKREMKPPKHRQTNKRRRFFFCFCQVVFRNLCGVECGCEMWVGFVSQIERFTPAFGHEDIIWSWWKPQWGVSGYPRWSLHVWCNWADAVSLEVTHMLAWLCSICNLHNSLQFEYPAR